MLQEIANHAGRPVDLDGVSGIVGPHGMDISLPPGAQIVLLKITNAEFATSSGSGTGNPPPRVWRTDPLVYPPDYYPQNMAWTKGRRVYWEGGQYDPAIDDSDPEEELIFHSTGYPSGPAADGTPNRTAASRHGSLSAPLHHRRSRVVFLGRVLGGWQILQGGENFARASCWKTCRRAGRRRRNW